MLSWLLVPLSQTLEAYERNDYLFCVIAENDESQWQDSTGFLYHFPSRYRKKLVPGTKVIYYKGSMKKREFAKSRLSEKPHYFGIAEIGKVYKDRDSHKGDLFAVIENYEKFSVAVLAKNNEEYLELIPENREKNYWRDGVRPITHDIYTKILNSTSSDKISDPTGEKYSHEEYLYEFESLEEGSKKLKYVTTYERNPKLRIQAIAIHGTTCIACGFNFEISYGGYAKGIIHIHHIKPISTFEETKKVDPETEMVPLCPNCHSVVHRQKAKTLTIEELKELLSKASNNKLKRDR